MSSNDTARVLQCKIKVRVKEENNKNGGYVNIRKTCRMFRKNEKYENEMKNTKGKYNRIKWNR